MLEAMEYLALCFCTGRWFAHDVSASGDEAVDWLKEFEAPREQELQELRQFAASFPGAESNARKLIAPAALAR